MQFMTQKFHKYERRLLREYINTVRDVKSYDVNTENDIQLDSGMHNISAMHFQSILSGSQFPHNTNMDSKQSMMLSHLPIMSK